MDPSTDWYRLGVEARLAGRPRTENPRLRPGDLPEITGQSLPQWSANRDRWWEGWEAEDQRQSSRPVVGTDRRSR